MNRLVIVFGLGVFVSSVISSSGAEAPSKNGAAENLPVPHFPPGEAIRVSPKRGMAQIGRGQVGNTHRPIIAGTADVSGKGPFDLFLFPDRLMPFRGFDQQGTPYYGPQVTTKGHPMNGMVLTGMDQQIYGVFSGGKSVHVCRFDRASSTFEPFAESPNLDIPGDLGMGIACYIDTSNKINVYFSVADGVTYRPPAPPDFKEGDYPPYFHRSSYMPFDGAGFWRGNIPRRMLYRARFDSLKLEKVELVERVSKGPGEFPFDCWGMAVLNLGKDHVPGLSSGEHLGVFHYYAIDPATGALKPNDFVNNEEQNGLRHFAINMSVKSIPDPKSGFSNLIVGDTARVWFYPFSGKFSANGAPIYKAPAAVLGEGIPMSLGELPIISPGDLDKDGRIDLIVGNDAGQLMFVKNIGTKQRPEFDNPVYVSVGGKPLDIKAGYRGSVQGPAEAMWGYTCPTLVDWNGDGRLDVILNSVLGDYVVLLQLPLNGTPKFAEPKWMYSDGIQLHLAWRCQPAVTDWGKRGGRLCVIGLDEQNLLRRFWRIDNENVERGELLTLQDGSSITANVDEQAGQTGRAKLVAHDWDQDGKMDLLIGTSRGLSFPASKTVYYPSAFYPNHKASVLFLRNVGTNEDPVFDYVRFVQFRGERIAFNIHDCSPAPVDLGRGVIDLLISEENGGIHYYPREELSIGPAAE
ncbi:FG-GAP repeat domain-containing protein [Schlesneria paludicola]|uniref:FG-GAP repeat domain-containing protein n=1 Tax=Schlesneria paludicola TaxID=360056 RepID=UPI00029AC830|nr:VCBS repeat-containing protein [Schlesneria paludicola]